MTDLDADLERQWLDGRLVDYFAQPEDELLYRQLIAVVAEHFDLDSLQAFRASIGTLDAYILRAELPVFPVIDLPRARAALKKLEAAMVAAAEALGDMDPVTLQYLHSALLQRDGGDKPSDAAAADSGFMFRLQRWPAEVIEPIEQLRAHIEISPIASPAIARTNLDELVMFDVCHSIWTAIRLEEIPIVYDHASDFAGFVVKMFETAGLRGSPQGAQRTWRKKIRFAKAEKADPYT